MSGIEFIVGTVLASVPIALEIYDRSGRVFEVFSTVKQYPREVLILEAKLGNQRTIFRNNAINLLTAITKDRAKVQEIMNQPSSPTAREGLVMASAYEHRIDALDESFVACRQTAEQIQRTLQSLCFQSDAFRAEVGENKQMMSTSEWLKHIRTSFKLGLNKPQIKKAIEELRDFNRDFGLITEQITKTLQEILPERKDSAAPNRKSARSLNILQRYYRTRYASNALYSTLQVRWSCSSHHSHSFDMRVIDCDPGRSKSKGQDSVGHFVTCELTITHDGSSYATKEPLRLEVEQACESDDEEPPPQPAIKETKNIQQLTTVLETNTEKFKVKKPVASTSKVRNLFKGFRKDKQGQSKPSIATAAVPVVTQSLAGFHISSPTSMTVTASTTADLALVDDFCIKFQEAMTDCIGRSLLGSWRGPHAQWYCLPPAPPTALGTSQSLSDLIRWIAEEPVLRSLPRSMLVELAGNVAEGIMQFYKTPWLVPADLGQNVRCFSPTDSSATAVQLKGPYFMARLESTRSKGKRRISTGARTLEQTADVTDARNKLLFNFGILLLEIGYGKPWYELKKIVAKMPTATGEKLTDYRAAEKLAQLLVNQMGLTYPKIIKKCLGCDFGLGETDLDNEDLQRRFLEDVVLGLQQLKEDMREVTSRF